MRSKQADLSDVLDVTRLALVLWPDHSMPAMALGISETIQENRGAYFLAFDKNEAIGFAQINLKHNYIKGTKNTSVGYLEGIFVLESYRQQGVAKMLLTLCKQWALEQGCEVLGSDCELLNEQRLNFYRYTQVETVNCISG